MSSAYRLTPSRVRDLIPNRAAGFYRLGTNDQNRFRPEYFGRSDTRLRERLVSHARDERAERFQALVTDNIRRAFELECREWHLRGDRLENKIHPAHPKHLDYQCPYCDLEDRLKTAETPIKTA